MEVLIHTTIAVMVACAGLLIATYVLPYFTCQPPIDPWEDWRNDDGEMELWIIEVSELDDKD